MLNHINGVSLEFNPVRETGTDLNNYRTEGIYFFSYAYRPSNIPTGENGNGWCMVLPTTTAGEGYCIQFWFAFGSSATNVNHRQIFKRTYFNGTWTPWYRLLNNIDLDDILSRLNYEEITPATLADLQTLASAVPNFQTKLYVMRATASQAVGLPNDRHFVRVSCMGGSMKLVEIIPLSTARYYYKMSQIGGTWTEIVECSGEAQLTSLTNRVSTNETAISNMEPIYFQILTTEGIELIFDTTSAPTWDLLPKQVFLIINHGQVSLTFDFQPTASISSGTDCTFPDLKILKPSVSQFIPTKATRGTSPLYVWDATLYGSGFYFKALSGANPRVNNRVTFNYFSKDALDVNNIRSILGAYEQPIPS